MKHGGLDANVSELIRNLLVLCSAGGNFQATRASASTGLVERSGHVTGDTTCYSTGYWECWEGVMLTWALCLYVDRRMK
jgi:hypothetical protein